MSFISGNSSFFNGAFNQGILYSPVAKEQSTRFDELALSLSSSSAKQSGEVLLHYSEETLTKCLTIDEAASEMLDIMSSSSPFFESGDPRSPSTIGFPSPRAFSIAGHSRPESLASDPSQTPLSRSCLICDEEDDDHLRSLSPKFSIQSPFPGQAYEVQKLLRGVFYIKPIPLMPKKISDFIKSIDWLKPYAHIPKTSLYKLFIDQKRWSDPRGGLFNTQWTFDIKEDGYMRGMKEGFKFVMAYPAKAFLTQKKLSALFIEQLHRKTVSGVRSCRRNGNIPSGHIIKGSTVELRTGFRQAGDFCIESFAINPYDHSTPHGITQGITATSSGIKLFNNKCLDQGRYGYTCQDSSDSFNIFADTILNRSEFKKFDPQKNNFPTHFKLSPVRNNQLFIEHVEQLITVFYNEPKESEQEKLLAIARLVQDLDQLHPFYDGNIRVFGILLLNRLLIDLDLSPTCLEDPNCLDCLSLEEIVNEIKIGQEHFASLKKVELDQTRSGLD